MLNFRTAFQYFDETTCATVYVSHYESGSWYWYIEDMHENIVRECGDILYDTPEQAREAASAAFNEWDKEQTPEKFR